MPLNELVPLSLSFSALPAWPSVFAKMDILLTGERDVNHAPNHCLPHVPRATVIDHHRFVLANTNGILWRVVRSGVTVAPARAMQRTQRPSGAFKPFMLTISGTIRSTPTPDGAILLDVERGQMFCLNGIGSKILGLLGNGCNEEQITAQVSAAYGADVDQVRDDVHNFLETLTQNHILT